MGLEGLPEERGRNATGHYLRVSETEWRVEDRSEGGRQSQSLVTATHQDVIQCTLRG